jgi:hypothetical protein
VNDWRSFNSRLTVVGHATSSGVNASSGVKPHLLVFQKAKYSFKQRPQFFLVVFVGGEFAEPHPLLLISQIGQISLMLGQDLRRRWLRYNVHVTIHCLRQLRIDLIGNRHNVGQQQAEINQAEIMLQGFEKSHL